VIYHHDHNADLKAADTSTALHIPADVHMDTVDGTGLRLSKPPVYELPKDHSKAMVSPKEPPCVPEGKKENIERDHPDSNGNGISMSPQSDVTHCG
jgi:hypothetical protein